MKIIHIPNILSRESHHIVDTVANIQIYRLERVADVMVELGIFREMDIGKRIPPLFPIIDDRNAKMFRFGRFFSRVREKGKVIAENNIILEI